MNYRKIAALALLGAFAASTPHAANNAWTRIYTDNPNGIFVSAISETTSMTTPPLALQYPGSRVVQAVQFVSGTGGTVSTYGSVGAAIGGSTAASLAAATSGTVLPATSTSSASTVTAANSFAGVGFVVSSSANTLVNGRVIEIKQ